MQSLLAAILAGLIMGLAPLDHPAGLVLRLLACGLLPWVVRGRLFGDTVRGGIIGVGWYATSLYWFVDTWTWFGSPGDPWLAFVGLVALQSVVPAFSLGLAGALVRRGAPMEVALGVALVIGGAISPWVQPLPAGFEVYLATHPALLGPAAIGGASLFLATIGVWAGSWRTPAFGLGLTAVWLLSPFAIVRRADHGPEVTIAWVQPNVGPYGGRLSSTADARALDLLASIEPVAHVDLVLTPEGAWPHDIGPPSSDRRDRFLQAWADRPPTLVGGQVTEQQLPTNSMMLIAQGREVARYDKQDLIALGERRLLGFGRDNFVAGVHRGPLVLGDIHLSVRICYEDLLQGRWSQLGTTNLVATPSNDAWLGSGAGSWAHLAASRLAAATTGRWVVRPTMNGRSAVFDPLGRTRALSDWVDEGAAVRPNVQTHRVRLTKPWLSGADIHPWLALLAALLAIRILVHHEPTRPHRRPHDRDRHNARVRGSPVRDR